MKGDRIGFSNTRSINRIVSLPVLLLHDAGSQQKRQDESI